MSTRAPSCRKYRLISLPKPVPPPVTTMDLPCKAPLRSAPSVGFVPLPISYVFIAPSFLLGQVFDNRFQDGPGRRRPPLLQYHGNAFLAVGSHALYEFPTQVGLALPPGIPLKLGI